MNNKQLLTNGIIVLLLLVASVNSSFGQASTNGGANQKFIAANWKLGVQMWTFRLFTQQEALEKTETAGMKGKK